MAMKEDYVSYELAKKLKACGFDEQKERIIAKPYTIGGVPKNLQAVVCRDLSARNIGLWRGCLTP